VADQKVPRAICHMSTVWIIAFINYAPAIILWEFVAGKRTVKDGECQAEFHDNLVYLTLTACVEFFVPLVSICSLNLAVYLNIRKRSRGLIRSENPMFTIKEARTLTSEKTSTIKSSSFQKTTTPTITPPPPAVNATTPNPANTKQEATLPPPPPPPPQPPMDQIKVLDETYKNKRKSIITSASETSSSSDELPTKAAAKTVKTKTKSSIRIKFKLNSRLSLRGQEVANKKATTIENLVKTPLITNRNNNNNNNNNNNVQFKPITTTKINTINIDNNNNPRKSVLHIKKPTTARTTLSKDKKAARSLFILVFVFVSCWVKKKHILQHFTLS
jgi:hypothetical protein